MYTDRVINAWADICQVAAGSDTAAGSSFLLEENTTQESITNWIGKRGRESSLRWLIPYHSSGHWVLLELYPRLGEGIIWDSLGIVPQLPKTLNRIFPGVQFNACPYQSLVSLPYNYQTIQRDGVSCGAFVISTMAARAIWITPPAYMASPLRLSIAAAMVRLLSASNENTGILLEEFVRRYANFAHWYMCLSVPIRTKRTGGSNSVLHLYEIYCEAVEKSRKKGWGRPSILAFVCPDKSDTDLPKFFSTFTPSEKKSTVKANKKSCYRLRAVVGYAPIQRKYLTFISNSSPSYVVDTYRNVEYEVKDRGTTREWFRNHLFLAVYEVTEITEDMHREVSAIERHAKRGRHVKVSYQFFHDEQSDTFNTMFMPDWIKRTEIWKRFHKTEKKTL